MPLFPLKYPPGVYRNGTQQQSAGRWWMSNLARFTQGQIRPVGGWRLRTEDTFEGAARAIHTWRDLGSASHLAVGTHSHLFAMTLTNVVSDITPTGYTAGYADTTVNTGYGGGLYGTDLYGVERPQTSTPIDATVWSLDNFGENLVACADSDGDIYQWELDPMTPAEVVPNAPTACEGIFVTNERILAALGADGDDTKIAWSDQEDIEDWTPTALNQAGDFNFQTSGKLMCGIRLRALHLVLTDTDAHTMRYLGPPFVYGFERAGEGCGVIAKGAAIAADDHAFWMGEGQFFGFQGFVQPLQCDVSDYVFSDINRGQIAKVTATHNAEFGEVWWDYPSKDSLENNRRVRYNYREGTWMLDVVSRTAGTDSGDNFPFPLMLSPPDEDGLSSLYEHEVGLAFDEGDEAYVETGPIFSGNADQVMRVFRAIPDDITTTDRITLNLFGRDWPLSADRDSGDITSSRAKWDFRFYARIMRARFTFSPLSDGRLGVVSLDIKAGGRR